LLDKRGKIEESIMSNIIRSAERILISQAFFADITAIVLGVLSLTLFSCFAFKNACNLTGSVGHFEVSGFAIEMV
jgi:hypothetical protein